MSFFYEKLEEKLASKEKLPIRDGKKLPLRGNRRRRLKLLRQFKVGHVYTFPQYVPAALRNNLHPDLLLEDHNDEHHRNRYN